uniref:Uncharacterized protein n=1 Tax=Anguilla anguilla TaxID=7936 RepID=A0A0E9TID0_ANGAN
MLSFTVKWFITVVHYHSPSCNNGSVGVLSRCTLCKLLAEYNRPDNHAVV